MNLGSTLHQTMPQIGVNAAWDFKGLFPTVVMRGLYSGAQGAEFSSQNCQGDLCDFVAHAHSAHLFQETREYTVISGPNMSFSLVLQSFNICALRNLEKSKPPEPSLGSLASEALNNIEQSWGHRS